MGWGGTGTFNQSGGTYNAWFLQIGYMGTGTYSLSGTGLLTYSAGEGIVSGTFTQSGGTNAGGSFAEFYIGGAWRRR